MLMIHYVDLTVEAYRGHLAEVNRALAGLAARGGKCSTTKESLTAFKEGKELVKKLSSDFQPPLPLKNWQRRQLGQLLADHTRASMRIAAINGDFTSSLTLVLLGLHIAINIIYSHRLLVVDHFCLWNRGGGGNGNDLFWPNEGLYLLLIIVGQFCVIAVLLVPFARVNAELYRTQKFLPQIVPRLDVGNSGEIGFRSADTILKLRLTEMCDRLGNAELRKIGFSMGPRRVITYKVLFEVGLEFFKYSIDKSFCFNFV